MDLAVKIVLFILLGLFIIQIIVVTVILPILKKKRDEKIAKEHKELVKNIKSGHEVLLQNGIYGTYVNSSGDETFNMRINEENNVIIKVNKSAILGFFDKDIAKKIEQRKQK